MTPSPAFRELWFALAAWREDTRTDGELLRRFAAHRDEDAFRTLVGRHGRLVWGVCQRVLGNAADAEDAVQATFLRLARDAGRIARTDTLAGWLFAAARCSALDLRRSIRRRRRLAERLADTLRADPADPADLRRVLDDELAHLPEKYRLPVILCSLEGRTCAEAALELRCSVAAVHRRLVRGQDLLRQRLLKHDPAGVGAVAGLAVAAPTKSLAAAAAAGLAAAPAGGLAVGLGVSVGGWLKAVAAAGVVAVVGALAVGPGGAGCDPVPAAPAAVGPRLTGVVRDPAGRPVAGATMVALAREPFAPGRRGLRDAPVATAVSGPDGRFDLHPPAGFATWFPERRLTLLATAPGATPASLPVRLDAGEPITLTLAAGEDRAGRAVDATGRPAAGVRVSVVRLGDVAREPNGDGGDAPAGWPADAVTAADGRFRLAGVGRAANLWVRVADPRYAVVTARLGDGPLTLIPARTLALTVRGPAGEPLPAARVTVVADRLRSHVHHTAAAAGVRGVRAVPAGELDLAADESGVVRVGLQPGNDIEVLVSPPAGVPCLGVRRKLTLPAGAGETAVDVPLPAGRWVDGTVRDVDTGLPLEGAVVQWNRAAAAQSEWRDDTLVGRDSLARTDDSGRFRLAVAAGECVLRVYGPDPGYPPVATPGPAGRGVLFAHHTQPLPASVGAVEVALRRGRTVAGAVTASSDLTVLAGGRVSPVRPQSVLPLPAPGGRFEVPGCRPGVVTRVHLFDPVARRGGTVDVTPGITPAVELAACGTARLRVTDADGCPVAGEPVAVSLLFDRDRPAGEPAVADPQPADWFDPVNYADRVMTAADGTAELPALIPGGRYTVRAGGRSTAPFVAVAGTALDLPALILPAEVAP